jgi:hypothetical protein
VRCRRKGKAVNPVCTAPQTGLTSTRSGDDKPGNRARENSGEKDDFSEDEVRGI